MDCSALSLDLLLEEGGTAALGDPANATAALAKVLEWFGRHLG